MLSNKDFKVNEYITLKLEGGKTNIYVKGELFQQCKFLLLNIPVEEISSFDNIQSVDETAEKHDSSLEGVAQFHFEIPPEVKFWGHCSNMQVWAENNYNTRILHRNLAFPLLKKLIENYDPIAKKVFNKEIAKRLSSGHLNVFLYLLEEGYIDYWGSKEFLSASFSELNSSEIINAIKDLKGVQEIFLSSRLVYNLEKTSLKNIKKIGKIITPLLGAQDFPY